MDKRTGLFSSLGLTIGLAVLTFATSAMQWLIDKLIPSVQHTSLLSSVLIIICIVLWDKTTHALLWLPPSSFWKILCYSISVLVLILLTINSLNPPVARITGQVRSLSEVVDVLVFATLAEELIFRGVMWSMAKELVQTRHRRAVTLIGTSVLFGVGHLGYWALSDWPLPPEAMMHALLMVVAGAFFGGLRLASRSLFAPIAIHMLANGIILLTQ